MGERTIYPAPPLNLYRLHECHYEYNEVESQYTGPGYSETLARAVSLGMDGREHCNAHPMT